MALHADIMLAAAAATPRGGGSRDLGPMMLWLGVLMVIVIGAGLGVMWYRRRVLEADSADAAEHGLMAQLRTMRDEGMISPAEYDAMRKSMARKAAARHAPDSPQPRRHPVRTDPTGAHDGEASR